MLWGRGGKRAGGFVGFECLVAEVDGDVRFFSDLVWIRLVRGWGWWLLALRYGTLMSNSFL